jgi:hypothetical protein
MDAQLTKLLLSSLGRHAFEAFSEQLLNAHVRDRHEEEIEGMEMMPLPSYKVPTGRLRSGIEMLLDPDPYSGTFAFEGFLIYILHYLPSAIWHCPGAVQIASPSMRDTLASLDSFLSRRPVRDFVFLNNYPEAAPDWMFHDYVNLLESAGFPNHSPSVGTVDSIPLTPSTYSKLRSFLLTHRDGLSVELGLDGPQVREYSADGIILTSGKEGAYVPLEPVFTPSNPGRAVLREFESLLQSEPSERMLEEFIREHYREVFGFTYEQIQTQLWLRFPELDVRGKPRRLDLLLRNGVQRDWELIELKKSSLRLTGHYRDVPVLSREITNAVQQIRNYRKILEQDAVRRNLRLKGIDYCEISARLVVGRDPALPWKEWRSLQQHSLKDDVRIMTYDELVREMRSRFANRSAL